MAGSKCELDNTKTCPSDCMMRQIGRKRILEVGMQIHPTPVSYAASMLCARIGANGDAHIQDRVCPACIPTPTGRRK